MHFGLPNLSPENLARKGADAREVMQCLESISEAGRLIVNFLIERLSDYSSVKTKPIEAEGVV